MKSISLKRSIWVKNQGEHVLALDMERDTAFRFTGDLGRVVILLSRIKACDLEQLKRKLSASSRLFAANRNKDRCLQAAIRYLKKNDLLEKI